jgi:hypothetical protein
LTRISRRSRILSARGVLILGLLAAAFPACAQFPTSLGETGAGRRVVIQPNGQITVVQDSRTYLSVSPLTVFQFTNTSPVGNGDYQTRKTDDFGPFIQLEKHYPLHSNPGNQPSSVVLGAWYWGHTTKKDNNPDRLGLYSQYNFNRNFSVQATLGGSTRGPQSGLFEYYGFLLYQPTLPHSSRIGVQAGVGPYFVRHSIGDTGYTYTAGAVYSLTPRYSLSASYWKVNYNKPPGTFGTGIHNDLARTNLSLVYNFK